MHTSVDIQATEPVISPTRLCITCANEIPTARLKAKPNATQCVPCLNAAGDVSPLKRFDEGDEQTYFTHNRAFETQMHRVQTGVPNAKILSETTEAAPVEDGAPEKRADERARNTAFAMIDQQEETEKG